MLGVGSVSAGSVPGAAPHVAWRMSRWEAWLSARWSSGWHCSSGCGLRRRSHSPSPRTRRTTGGSPAILPRAAASSPMPSGGSRPGAGSHHRSVWLLLPATGVRDLAAAAEPPRARADAGDRLDRIWGHAAGWSPPRRLRPGDRLADRGGRGRGAGARRRALPDAGARRRPRAAIALPLVLPSVHLDSTNPFALPALVACLLMVRLVRRPPQRLFDARLVGLGLAIGVAGLARNEAAWVGSPWRSSRPGSWGGATAGAGGPSCPACARPGPHRRRRHGALAGSKLAHLRLAAPGPAIAERLGGRRVRDLRLAGAGNRVRRTSRSVRRPGWSTGSGVPPDLRGRSPPPGGPARRGRPDRPSMGSPPAIPATAPGPRPADVSRSRRSSSRSRRAGERPSTPLSRPPCSSS